MRSKKILTIFFVTLGIIFFLLILVGGYLYVADPFNIKPLFLGSSTTTREPASILDAEATVRDTSTGSGTIQLSDEQRATLTTMGIDPESIPTEITPEQEACFVDILGAERVAEIKAGASPSASEMFRVRNCLS